MQENEEKEPEMYYHKFSEKYFKLLKRNSFRGQHSNDKHTIGYPKRKINDAKTTHMTWVITDAELKSSCEPVHQNNEENQKSKVEILNNP